MFSVTLLYFVLDIALLVGITGAEVEAVPGGSTRDADIVVGDKSGLEDFILPVGIARPRGEIKFGIAFISPTVRCRVPLNPRRRLIAILSVTRLKPETSR